MNEPLVREWRDIKHANRIEEVMIPIRPLRFSELSNFDTRHDPDCLIGMREDGTTTRFLGRGGSCWLIGPSGIGKSSFVYQLAIMLIVRRRCFGLRATRALRISVIQAENDIGDCSEMIQGVREGLGDLSAEELALLEDSFFVHTESSVTGEKFCGRLREIILADKSDLAVVDPLLSFAGIDVSKQEQCSRFLRSWLNPVLVETRACLIATHHTGKPPREKETRHWTTMDWMYAFLGSSELMNWSRAAMVLRPVDDAGNFMLQVTKRSKRAGLVHPDGTPTTSIWLRHGQRGICWEQIPPPEESAATPEERPKKLTKPEQVQGMNTASFLAGCAGDGESLRGIGKRLLNWAVSNDSPKKLILSKSTSERAIELLLESKKLQCREGLYFKGENA